MFSFLFRRLFLLILTTLGVSILIFFVIRQIPGDAILALLGGESFMELTDQERASYRAYFGLDKPLPQQYSEWILKVFQGDLGMSETRLEPVFVAIGKTYFVTFELSIISLVIALGVGLPIGYLSAIYVNTSFDFLVRMASALGLSLPNFWFGTLIILVLSNVFNIMPNAGRFTPFTDNPLKNMGQIIFPALALSFPLAAALIRMTRSALLENLTQDYVRTARAKGLQEKQVVIKHVFRNSLLPISNFVGVEMGYLLGGAVLIEESFSLPGIGQLIYNAIMQRDYALVQGAILFTAFNFMLLNLFIDLFSSILDPRIAHA